MESLGEPKRKDFLFGIKIAEKSAGTLFCGKNCVDEKRHAFLNAARVGIRQAFPGEFLHVRERAMP